MAKVTCMSPQSSPHLQVGRLPLLCRQCLLPPGRSLLCPQQRLPGRGGLLPQRPRLGRMSALQLLLSCSVGRLHRGERGQRAQRGISPRPEVKGDTTRFCPEQESLLRVRSLPET